MAALSGEPDGARIIDANLNRAAEALRVAEDICRFHLELPCLSRELKEIRHAVLRAFAGTVEGRARLVRWRDIEEDVGRGIAADSPPAPDLPAVALRNLQRAKEALRCLEEVGRLSGGSVSGEAADLRYRLYSAEKGILALGSRAGGGPLAGVRLYIVAAEALSRIPLAQAVRAALAGGAGAVQLREKGLPDRRLLPLGRTLREITARAGAPLLVNDRPDLAAILHADGVHLGQEDLPVAGARAILGEGRIVGVSTHDADQARRAAREGADYIGAGPVFETRTKDAGAPLGAAGLKAILEACDLPAFAIGGIRAEVVPALVAVGCRRVAVAAGVLAAGGAADIEAAARAMVSALERSA